MRLARLIRPSCPVTARPGPTGHLILGHLRPLILTAAVVLALSASAAAQSGTTFAVNSTADTSDANPGDGVCADASGACSFRAAIEESNASAAVKDTIAFAIPGSPPYTIQTGGLPTVTDPGVIDGTTQCTPVCGSPVVELVGGCACPAGLDITAGDTTVRGLVIRNFGIGVDLRTNGGDRLEGNYIGLDVSGAVSQPSGVVVRSSGNRIGGTTPAQRNVISDDGNSGVALTLEAGADNNMIEGNFIGTNAAGTGAPVGASGVFSGIGIRGSGNTVGGTEGTTPGVDCTGACNLISGNTEDGLVIFDSGTDTHVEGNFIGTDVHGTTPVPNGLGIAPQADRATIGGTEAHYRNVISGNVNEGIIGGGSGTVIIGNFIGTDTTGTSSLGNGAGVKVGLVGLGPSPGLRIGGTDGTTPGGDCTGSCNLISGNRGAGVQIQQLDGVQVQGNYIGTDVSGGKARGNGGAGVGVVASADVIIGGVTPAARNVISANGTGIGFNDGTGDVVEGNYIGTDATGTVALGNAAYGLALSEFFSGGSGFRIGGTEGTPPGGDCTGACNLISGNGEGGITIPFGTQHRIEGNMIGTDVSGEHPLRNGTDGINVGGTGHLVAGNVISANGNDGIFDGGLGTIIQGNLIGTDRSGGADLGNAAAGVVVNESQTHIGGPQPGQGNVISGNGGAGIFFGPSGVQAVIEGNRIGTDASGLAKLGNDGDGIAVGLLGGDTIGGGTPLPGPCSGACNLISGNGGNGIEYTPPNGGFGDRVEGNFIGTNVDGTVALGNRGAGIKAVVGTTIGGDGAGNLISGNADGVVLLPNAAAPGTTQVEGNRVGTTASGGAPLPNAGFGIRVEGERELVAGNLVSGNAKGGVLIEGQLATLHGNSIGTDAAGGAALANTGPGVEITAGADTIGGSAAGDGNLISGNRGSGILVMRAHDNTIQGNRIGTDASARAALPNAGDGVELADEASRNHVGGTNAGAEGNTIAFNAGTGVSSTGASAFGNAILGNSIFRNGKLGIDLNNDGVTPNDTGDVDQGPNFLQNFPVLTAVMTGGGSVTIEGTLNTDPSSSGITYRLEFFSNTEGGCDPSDHGEGETFLGAQDITTDSGGHAGFSATFAANVPSGAFITSTATDPSGNTSEFSGCAPVTPAATLIVRKETRPAGDTATFTFSGDGAGTIGDGQTIAVSGLAPGTYRSTETVPNGWDLGSIRCDDSDSTGDVASATATFRLAAGEAVTCTFTDDKRGTIVVKKETQPASAAGSFTFTGDAAGTIGDGGTITVPNLSTVGSPTYRTTEADPTPNFDLTSISCDDATSANPSSGDRASRTASFRLDPGETVVCTFTDTQRGTVSVRKTVSGSPISSLLPPEQQSFTFQLRKDASTTSAGMLLEQADANVANSGVVNFASRLVAGSPYQLCEIVMPGWRTSLAMPFVLFNPSGDNSTLCTNFSVAPGEARSIAVDNQPPPAGIARTIGFWKNWASCASSRGNQRPVLDQTLAAAEPAGIAIGTLPLHGSTSTPNTAPDCLKAVRLLNKSTIDTGRKMSPDPAFNLAAQLLAADLNVKAGALTCPSAISAINEAQALLAANHFNGITHDKLSAAQATEANNLASTLDRYNNNLLC